MANKYCYLFSEGNANMRELLGGKGSNLAEMTNIGLPVPQGFTITTEACTQYYEDGGISDEIMAEINEYITKMEEITGKKFGDKENPLLVSVRSGARASMPGMMDTILNLGLNETVVETIAAKSGNPRGAWDCYRRFIQMYSDVVMEVGKKYFEQLIDAMKEKRGVKLDIELTAADLKELAHELLLTGGGVTGEGDAGTGVVVQVAEDHRHDVDGSAPGIGDVVVAAIDVRARVVPGAEHGADGFVQLGLGVGGEVLADLLLVLGIELLGEFLEVG